MSPSPFAGKGLFTTSDASSASGLHSDWVAVQKDQEGDPAPVFNNNPGRLCWWQARPSQAVVDVANERGIPYIGQAENEDELWRCLGLTISVPKALVGNAGSWSDEGRKAASSQRWDLIQEWYWNKHPWETAPDAHNYPRFVNVCFGFFSEAETTYKSLADYRAVWGGSFSVWCAEQLNAEDRAEYQR